MLTGEAKRNYQRDYMRRRRAGQAAPEQAAPERKPPPPPKPWQPPERLIEQIAYWIRHPRSRRGLGDEVMEDLHFDTDEEWMEACHRHKGITEWRREQKRNPPPKPVRKPTCSFCYEPQSATRIFVNNGFTNICEMCVAECVKVIAAMKAERTVA
jgi:ClpX C4-type zinc finger